MKKREPHNHSLPQGLQRHFLPDYYYLFTDDYDERFICVKHCVIVMQRKK